MPPYLLTTFFTTDDTENTDMRIRHHQPARQAGIVHAFVHAAGVTEYLADGTSRGYRLAGSEAEGGRRNPVRPETDPRFLRSYSGPERFARPVGNAVLPAGFRV